MQKRKVSIMCWLAIPQCTPTSKRRATHHLHSLKNQLKKTFEIVHYLPDMMACVCNLSILEAETGQPRLHSKFKRLCHGSKRDSSCNMKVLLFLSFSEIRSYIADFVLLCNLGASRTFDFPDSSSQELDSKPVPLYLCWGLNPGQRHVRLTLYQLNCTTSLGK